ncbi:MAG: MurR/RpiR family transcriptional regulator [Pararhizobium sp.]
MRVEERVRATLGALTAAERKAARGLLSHYPSAGLAPVAEFARIAATSAPTVLRFVARLGFAGYPDFQRALREELRLGRLSPLEKGPGTSSPDAGGSEALGSFFERVQQNLNATMASIPQRDFEAACQLIADSRKPCCFLGGRFTDFVAGYLATHMRIVRPGVRRLEGQVSTWKDQLLDVKAGDVFVIFDIRRYQDDLLETARRLAGQKARIVLVTDPWLSPIAQYSKVVLPCGVDVGRTWDSSATLFALSEAIINRVTSDIWPDARTRIAALESRAGA